MALQNNNYLDQLRGLYGNMQQQQQNLYNQYRNAMAVPTSSHGTDRLEFDAATSDGAKFDIYGFNKSQNKSKLLLLEDI